MAELQRRHWFPALGLGVSRRDRAGCDYDAYVPDSLVGRPISLDGGVAADVAAAEAAIASLNREAVSLADSEALARLLLRAESVASSRIEGLEVGARRLLRAEAAREFGEERPDVTAEEVLGNIGAMAFAIEVVAGSQTITVDQICEVHRRLLAGTRLEEQGGRIRDEQNWIGGSGHNPCSAAFIPPPPEAVPALLEDLCAFLNEESLPVVVQAAVAHAQFETIHPFADGNGRTGRALVHVVMRRRGLAPRLVPPTSRVLATWSDRYVAGLTATRYVGDARTDGHEGLNRWIALFAAASIRAVADARQYEARVEDLERGWRESVGRIRRRSAVDLLLAALPGAPLLTVGGAAALIGRSFQAANEAVEVLVDAGILRASRVGRRNRAFEAPALIDAFADLERRLASPDADTLVSPPSRPVPQRRQSTPDPPAGR